VLGFASSSILLKVLHTYLSASRRKKKKRKKGKGKKKKKKERRERKKRKHIPCLLGTRCIFLQRSIRGCAITCKWQGPGRQCSK